MERLVERVLSLFLEQLINFDHALQFFLQLSNICFGILKFTAKGLNLPFAISALYLQLLDCVCVVVVFLRLEVKFSFKFGQLKTYFVLLAFNFLYSFSQFVNLVFAHSNCLVSQFQLAI